MAWAGDRRDEQSLKRESESERSVCNELANERKRRESVRVPEVTMHGPSSPRSSHLTRLFSVI